MPFYNSISVFSKFLLNNNLQLINHKHHYLLTYLKNNSLHIHSDLILIFLFYYSILLFIILTLLK